MQDKLAEVDQRVRAMELLAELERRIAALELRGPASQEAPARRGIGAWIRMRIAALGALTALLVSLLLSLLMGLGGYVNTLRELLTSDQAMMHESLERALAATDSEAPGQLRRLRLLRSLGRVDAPGLMAPSTGTRDDVAEWADSEYTRVMAGLAERSQQLAQDIHAARVRIERLERQLRADHILLAQERSRWDVVEPARRTALAESDRRIDDMMTTRRAAIDRDRAQLDADLREWSRLRSVHAEAGEEPPAALDPGALGHLMRRCDACTATCDAGRDCSPIPCDMDACFESAEILADDTRPREDDASRARTLYQRACDGDHPTACVRLGRLFQRGRGVEKDERRALELFRGACDAGDSSGCEALGRASDPAEARRSLERACWDMTSMGACDDLGRVLMDASGTMKDRRAAEELEREAERALACACGRDDVRGCVDLANLRARMPLSRDPRPR